MLKLNGSWFINYFLSWHSLYNTICNNLLFFLNIRKCTQFCPCPPFWECLQSLVDEEDVETVERQVILMHYAVFLEDWGSAIDQSAKWTRQSKKRAHLCVSISNNLQAEAIIVTVLSDVLVADGPNMSRVGKCFGMVNSEMKSISKSSK